MTTGTGFIKVASATQTPWPPSKAPVVGYGLIIICNRIQVLRILKTNSFVVHISCIQLSGGHRLLLLEFLVLFKQRTTGRSKTYLHRCLTVDSQWKGSSKSRRLMTGFSRGKINRVIRRSHVWSVGATPPLTLRLSINKSVFTNYLETSVGSKRQAIASNRLNSSILVFLGFDSHWRQKWTKLWHRLQLSQPLSWL